ncbi:MAG: hypothetical protein F6K19_27155 [Cyanothece sp. SIO1E1]|nr:hypothetical protein [Cyanothece sp. SIO1E1]
MKRLILAGLSALLLMPMASTVAKAQTSGYLLEPFNLVYLAYQGYFKAEGVPGFRRLITDYRAHRIGPEELVQAAIATHRLPAEIIEDQAYLSDVDDQLKALQSGDDGDED